KPKRRERRLKIASKSGKLNASSTCSSSDSLISSAMSISSCACQRASVRFRYRRGRGGLRAGRKASTAIFLYQAGQVAEGEQRGEIDYLGADLHCAQHFPQLIDAEHGLGRPHSHLAGHYEFAVLYPDLLASAVAVGHAESAAWISPRDVVERADDPAGAALDTAAPVYRRVTVVL